MTVYGFERPDAETLLEMARARRVSPQQGLATEQNIPDALERSLYMVVPKQNISGTESSSGVLEGLSSADCYVVEVINEDGDVDFVRNPGTGNRIEIGPVFNMCSHLVKAPTADGAVEDCTIYLAVQTNFGTYVIIDTCRKDCDSECVTHIGGMEITRIDTGSAASVTHVLGVDNSGCLVRVPVDTC